MTDTEAEAFAREFMTMDDAEIGVALERWIAELHPNGVMSWLLSPTSDATPTPNGETP